MRYALHLFFLFLGLFTPVLAGAQQPIQPVVRMGLDKESAVPGQPIILRVTVLAPTWLPKAPVFPSFEAPDIIVRLPSRASHPTSERVGGETWFGVTRAYRLYPMTVGRFRVPAQPLSVTFADPDTRAPVTVELRTEEIRFAGTAPQGAEDLDPFIAAEVLTLEQTIEGEPDKLEPGAAITRSVTARVTGTSPIFLPPLIPPFMAEGISAYPKEPVVTEKAERGVVAGERVESVTYVAEAGGRHTVPAIRLRWFNLNTRQVETTETPGFALVSRGPLPTRRSPLDWRAVMAWAVGGVLLVVLVGTTAIRRWPSISAWRQRRHEAYLGSEAFAFAQAKAALRNHKFGEAVRAVAVWSGRLPYAAKAEQTRLSEALAHLGARFYGRAPQPPANRQWSETLTALRIARRERLAASSAARANHGLPSLNPREEL